MTLVPQLAPDCSALVAAAAVIGAEFDVDVLAAVVDRDPLECLDVLAEARAAGIIEPADGPERSRFTSPAVHAAVLGELSASTRVQLHARVAEAIGTRYADRIDAHLLELAAHWSAAAVGDYRPAAARWVHRAASAALDRGAYEDAAQLYRRALGVGRDVIGDADHCEWLVGFARASYRTADIAAAVSACTEAAGLAAAVDRPDLLAEAALVVEPTLDAEVNMQLRRLCVSALDVTPSSMPSQRVRLTARVADISHYIGDHTAARTACSELERLVSDASDLTALPPALHALQLDASGPGGLAARGELATRLLDVARTLGDSTEEAWAHLWGVDTRLERGDIAAAAKELDAARRLGVDAQDVLLRWHLLRADATVAQAQARYDDAERLARRARDLFSTTGSPLGHLIWSGQQAAVAYHAGFGPELLGALGVDDDAMPAPLAGAVQVLSEASVLVGAGKHARAAAFYRSLGPVVTWQFQPHSELFTWTFGVICARALDQADDLALVRDRLERYRGHHVAAGAGCVAYFGPVELWLGVAAAHLGDAESARTDLESALVACGANGASGFHAQAQLELARVHATRAGPEDRRRASALAREALARAELLGASRLATDARGVLEDVERSTGDVLTPRELEVAQLVAQAMTNRAIAQRLYLSERTVANHVQHVFDKLGLANRAELVGWVRDREMSTD